MRSPIITWHTHRKVLEITPETELILMWIIKQFQGQLEDLVKPCVYQQLAHYRCLGMRARILSLPLMLAAVLTLVWRQAPSVRELNRMLARENLLWEKATRVSQQALSQRLLTFRAELFEKVLRELLITLNQRWSQRKKRPLPKSVAYANQHFERLWIVDASTLEALFRTIDSISVEMVFRGIYHFTQALNQDNTTSLITYLTAPENRDLGIVKSPRPKRAKPPLDLSPSPA